MFIGLAVVSLGMGYGIGSLGEMGPGFLPVTYGVLSMLIGFVIVITAAAPRALIVPAGVPARPRAMPQWRAWICIVGAVVLFVVLGKYGGLVPATFFAVFIAALGDRDNSLRGAAGLAVLLDLFGVLVFHYGLDLQLPLFRWG